MRAASSWRSFWRGVVGIIFMLAVWEAFARSGLFNQALTPPLARIARVTWSMLLNGSLLENAGYTLARVLISLVLACFIGIPIGMLMGRFRTMEKLFHPIVSVLMPIPSLAWVPLVVLWFGIGNATTIVIVTYAATFPVLYNVWTGVRAINPLWTRAAFAMGANQRQLFRKVVLPAVSPFLFTGVRLSFGRGWIAVIGGEMLANPSWGLGRLIFDAREFLNSEVMIASLIAIGVIGLVFERIVFQTIERRTIARWGMVTAAPR